MTHIIQILLIPITLMFTGGALAQEPIQDNNNGMIVRISEIEVHPEHLEAYLHHAKEVAEESVKHEKDVISIYPMSVIGNNAQIRIPEIYRSSLRPGIKPFKTFTVLAPAAHWQKNRTRYTRQNRKRHSLLK